MQEIDIHMFASFGVRPILSRSELPQQHNDAITVFTIFLESRSFLSKLSTVLVV